MALKKSFTITGTTSISGVPFGYVTGESSYTTPQLYIKVESVSASKTAASADVSYSNDDGIVTSKRFEFMPNLEGENFIKQAYMHLKSLDEFAGAVDC